MIKEKIKNLHYLEMYSKIKDNFNSAIEYSDNDNIYGFIYLKSVVEDLCNELMSLDQSVVSNNCKDNIAVLEYKGILNYEQVTLFSSILDIADKYAHGSENSERRKTDLESLKNFCIRLDKHLPFIMSNLGIGGSSRNKYINKNRFRKRTDIVVKDVNPIAKQEKTLAERLAKKNRIKSLILTLIIFIAFLIIFSGMVFIKNSNIDVGEFLRDSSRRIANEVIPDVEISIISEIKDKTIAVGINGEGYLNYSSNYEDNLLYSDEKIDIYLEDSMIVVRDLKANTTHSFNIEISKSYGLSNGEIISMTIPQEFNEFLKDYNLSLSSNSANKTISNLLDVKNVLSEKDLIISKISNYVRSIGESNTTEDLKWTGTVEKIYVIPSTISNKHSVVAYLCLKKTFYNWIVGIYQYQYFIDKYVFEADFTDQLNIDLNSKKISELSNWSSEYNYNKITEDFKEFYEDMNPIVLK